MKRRAGATRGGGRLGGAAPARGGSLIRRGARGLLGLALILPSVAVTRALWTLVLSIRSSSSPLPVGVAPLVGGFGLWLVVFFVFPRPVRAYILGHELTHALWGWLMGARVSGLRIGRNRGSVRVSRTNIWVTLAPYFFPFYTLLTVAAYGILSVFWDLSAGYPLWLGVIGFTWGFHFTFTVVTLLQRQPDIQLYGALLSYSLVYLFNVMGLVLGVIGVSSLTLEDMGEALERGWSRTLSNSREVWAWVMQSTRAIKW